MHKSTVVQLHGLWPQHLNEQKMRSIFIVSIFVLFECRGLSPENAESKWMRGLEVWFSCLYTKPTQLIDASKFGTRANANKSEDTMPQLTAASVYRRMDCAPLAGVGVGCAVGNGVGTT